jgi:hypothetical protein
MAAIRAPAPGRLASGIRPARYDAAHSQGSELLHKLIGQTLSYLASAVGWWTVPAYAKRASPQTIEDHRGVLFSMAPNVEWRGNEVKGRRRHANRCRRPLPNPCDTKPAILRPKTPTPVGIAGEIRVAVAGIRPELTSSAFSHAQRIRRERIMGWTLAVFTSLMAARFSKAKACA